MAQKTKHLKQFLTFIILAGLLHSCQFEDEVVENNNVEQNKFKIEKKNFDELMKVPQFKTAFSKIPKQKTKSNVVGKTVMEHEYGFNISNSPATVLSVGSQLTTYTFHITRETLLPVNQFENLVVQVDSTGTTSSYITKYFLNAEPIYNTTDGEYSFNINHKELTPIVYNNAAHVQNRIWYTGSDGCTIITLMCDFGPDHPAGTICINNAANRNFYLNYDNSNCQSDNGGGGGPSDSGGATGSSGSGPGQNGGSNSTHVTGIYTTPVLSEFDADTPCGSLKKLIEKKPTDLGGANTNPIRSKLIQNQLDAQDASLMGGEKGFILSHSNGLLATFPIASNTNHLYFKPRQYTNGFFHCHTVNTSTMGGDQTLAPMFSADDVLKLYEIVQTYNYGNPNYPNTIPGSPVIAVSPNIFVITVATENGDTYALKINDLVAFKDKMTEVNLTNDKKEIFKKEFEKNMKNNTRQGFSDIATRSTYEKNMLANIQNYLGSGISLFRAGDNFTKWSELKNINDEIKPFDCN